MPIVFLKPTGITDTGNLIVSGVLTDVDEGVSGADGNLQTSKTGTFSSNSVIFDLENLPTDAGIINSYKIRIRAQVGGGWTDDLVTFRWKLIPNGTNLDHGSLTWSFEAEDGDPLTDKVVTGIDSPTPENINAAQIQLFHTQFSQNMGPDGGFIAWDALELEVDYKKGIVAETGSVNISGQVANLAKTGDLFEATENFNTSNTTWIVNSIAHPARIGDILICAAGQFASGTGVPTLTGWTLLHSVSTANLKFWWWYKICDTYNESPSLTWDIAAVGDINWGIVSWETQPAPTVTKNENTANTTTNTNTQVTGALTPSKTINTLFSVITTQNELDSLDGQGYNPAAWIRFNTKEFQEIIDTGHILAYQYKATLTAQELTHTNTDTGDPMYGAIVLFEAGAADPVLDAQAGSFSITGTPANLEYGREVTAAAGTVAISGVIANLEYGYEVIADIGAFAIDGIAALFPRDYIFIASAGTFAISGTDANLEFHDQFSSEAGSFSITGTAADLKQGYAIQAQGPLPADGVTGSEDFSDAAWLLEGTPTIVTDVAVAPDGNTTADSIEDNNTGSTEGIAQFAINTLTPGTPNITSVFIKKDAVGRATRFSSLSLRFDGSTSEINTIGVDSNTGEFIIASINSTARGGVIDYDANYWLAWLAATTIDGANSVFATLFVPALGASSVWAINDTATGTVTAWGIRLDEGGFLYDHTLKDNAKYVLTGVGSNLEQGYKILADIGSFSITGIAATLTEGGADPVIDVQAGSFSISGVAAVLDKGFTLTASIGSFSINGIDVNLEQGYLLNIVAGSFSINGQTANLEFHDQFSSEAGNFSISGVAANLKQGYLVEVLVGTFNITGVAATLTEGADIVLDATAGSFSISGIVANLEYHHSLVAGPVTQSALYISSEIDEIINDCLSAFNDLTFTVPSDCEVFVLGMGGAHDYDSGSGYPFALPSTVIWDQGGTAQGMTLAATAVNNVPTVFGAQGAHLFYLINPTAGTHTLRITWLAAPDRPYEAFGFSAHYLKNIDLANPLIEGIGTETFVATTIWDVEIEAIPGKHLAIAHFYHNRNNATLTDGTTIDLNDTHVGVSTCVVFTDYHSSAYDDTEVNGIYKIRWTIALNNAEGMVMGLFSGPTDNVFGINRIEASLKITDIIFNANAGTFSITGFSAINASPGTYIITGSNMWGADAGSITISGQSANLEYGYSLTIDIGTFSINGQVANLEFHDQFSSETGNFLITGVDANLEFHDIFSSETGIFSITGFVATLTVTTGEITKTYLHPFGGVITLTGDKQYLHSLGGILYGNPPANTNTTLTANNGAFVISGVTAGLVWSAPFEITLSANINTGGENTTNRLTGGGTHGGGRIRDDSNIANTVDLAANESGEWAWVIQGTNDALTGVEYSFRIVLDDGTLLDTYSVEPTWTIPSSNPVLTADTGVYTVSGQTANLEQGYALTVNAGSILITGPNVGLFRGKGLNANTGIFSITGQIANLEHHKIFNVVAGTFSINGQTANLEYGRSILALTDSFLINGQIANLEQGYTVQANTTAFSITGSNVGLFRGKGLNAITGIFNISGQIANLEHHKIFTADTGVYSVNGFIANLEYGRSIQAIIGTFLINGQIVNLEHHKIFNVLAGTFSITGINATLTHSAADPVLVADPGTFSISGQTANLEIGYTIIANTGSLLVNGQAVNLEQHYVITADTTVFSIIGTNVGLFRGKGLNANTGIFIISGQTANLEYGRAIPVITGSFSINGQIANLEYHIVLPVDTGLISINSTNVGLFRGKGLNANTGIFTISGQNANLEYGYVVPANTGVFSITGFIATLIHNVDITLIADTGSYLITGQIANLKHNYVINANTGTYAISGITVVLFIGKGINANAGSFSISGQIANLEKGYAVIAETGTYTVTGQVATLIKTTIGVLSGTCAITFTVTSNLTGIGKLAGTISNIFTATSTLSAFVPTALSGTVSIITTLTSTLDGIAGLSGVSSIVFSSVSSLKGIGVLSGTGSFTFTSTVILLDSDLPVPQISRKVSININPALQVNINQTMSLPVNIVTFKQFQVFLG